MAGVFVSLVLDSVHDVHAGAKFTLVALADRAGIQEAGRTRAGQLDIAHRTSRDDRTVRNDLRLLEDRRWIVRSGNLRPTAYLLNLEKMLLAMPIALTEAHFRRLRRANGSLLPGFVMPQPAMHDTATGNAAQATGNALPGKRQPTADEPVQPSTSTGFEPGARANSQPPDTGPFIPIFRKLNTEPERIETSASASESANKPRLSKESLGPVETDEKRVARRESEKLRQRRLIADAKHGGG